MNVNSKYTTGIVRYCKLFVVKNVCYLIFCCVCLRCDRLWVYKSKSSKWQ